MHRGLLSELALAILRIVARHRLTCGMSSPGMALVSVHLRFGTGTALVDTTSGNTLFDDAAIVAAAAAASITNGVDSRGRFREPSIFHNTHTHARARKRGVSTPKEDMVQKETNTSAQVTHAHIASPVHHKSSSSRRQRNGVGTHTACGTACGTTDRGHLFASGDCVQPCDSISHDSWDATDWGTSLLDASRR